MSNNNDFPPPSGAPVPPPPGVPYPPEPGQLEEEHERNRTRVVVTIAALVATLGAIVLGFVLTGGHGSKSVTIAAVGSSSNAAVPSGSAAGTGQLSVPPAPSAQSSAEA